MNAEKKKTMKIIVTAGISLLLAIYVTVHIVSGFLPETQLYVVKTEEYDDAIVFSGYIFRDDKVISAGSEGSVELFYSSGDKIPAGATVADVYSLKNDDVMNRINAINREIKLLEKSAIPVTVSAAELDAQIEAMRLLISEKTSDGELAWVSAHGDELTVLLNKRELLSRGETNYDGKIAELKAERSELRSALGKKTSVVSEESGYFYPYCDGYEGMLTLDDATGVTIDNYDEVTGVSPINYRIAVGSLVTDFHWYFICRTDLAASEGYLLNTEYEATFIGNACAGNVTLKLEYKSFDYKTGDIVLRFSSTNVPADFDMTRAQKAKIIRGRHTGLCVPVPCVRVINGHTCVYIFKKGIARLREVKILWERDGIYLVEGGDSEGYIPLRENDLVITDDGDLYEGKVVG